MKNFDVTHMQENGIQKKTLSRKEYDEQLQLRFAAMEDEKHEQLSARAKEEFEQKTEEEKQEFMNEINDVQNKPLTYDLMKSIEEHKDITFFCIASTGLNTEDKEKAIKGKNGYEKKFIRKDEPTLFMAETYAYQDGLYVPKDSLSLFIEASKEVVDRAIQSAEAGGYDVFANADFNLPEYLAGKDVIVKEKAKEVIGSYFDKVSDGVVLCYGEFHENMLRGNDFPIPEDTIDLNRVMGEQGTFGTASLNKCVNQILHTDKDTMLELKSTSEKLVADALCLNKIMSIELKKPAKFQVKEENIDKFSDKDRETLLSADADFGLEIKTKVRQRRPRTPDQVAQMKERIRSRGGEAPVRASRGSEAPLNHEGEAPTRVSRTARAEEAVKEAPERPELPVPEVHEKMLSKSGFTRRHPKEERPAATPAANKQESKKASVQSPEEWLDFFDSSKDDVAVMATLNAGGVDDFFGDQDSGSRDEKKVEAPVMTAQNMQAMQASGFAMLANAILEQNKLLQERNELSMKQHELETSKYAEMQKQTELMERQSKQMEQLTVLMDNLTKVYSKSDVERMQVEKPVLPVAPAIEQGPLIRRADMARRSVPGESRPGFQRRIEALRGETSRGEAPQERLSNMTGALTGNIDSILEDLSSPEGQEMSLDAEPERKMRHQRIKEDDDIGRP